MLPKAVLVVSLLAALLLLGVASGGGGGEKYSEAKNAAPPTLRVQKIKFVWEKARARLPADRLKALQLELSRLDGDMLSAKEGRASGKDADGLHALAADKALRALLERHSLGDLLDSLDGQKAAGKDERADKQPNAAGEPADTRAFAKNKKLNKLWNEAIAAGFSAEELVAFKDELKHLFDKMLTLESAAVDENALHAEHDADADARTRLLKTHGADVRQGLVQLAERVERQSREGAAAGLTHPRARQMWAKALELELSADELDELRDELRHFEGRLRKLEQIKSQLDSTRGKLDEQGKPHAHYPEHGDLEKKLLDYNRKVDKLERYLESRVHFEL